ncbi:oxalate decarboxylase family bicupin [Lichenicola cladoniae]|uniref:Oxalate decarboxylase family bicupin n=1 Tax=Lichenicola cladoniae TaxID=1484109 RepID=A0A6M8HMB8_9PROT|nr:oxalate decarboxylase family bicupin [Lichenicola cladoniae]NPD66928.1 oxalate decarboxylase family bicupin [Acetobacteraceae bacterium]QKE89482.1 oxalate decarboxylase family bicupin [Lichenicola cladoniae]
MNPLPRRGLLAAAAGLGAVTAARAASFGNPDMPPQGRINALATPTGLTNPGPQNPALAGQFPSFQDPPATDVDGMPLFWASFNNAHRRIQNGGWAREVTQADFAISESISGVNMRLAPGGIREMHWHQQAEWAIMLTGNCRITTIDEQGRPSIDDVAAGDLWYFPPGLPHSLQGIGPDGAEFLLAFDNGMASEFNTLLLTDWLAHTPPEVLALNFNVPAETFKNIPLSNLWIFEGKEPGPLAEDRKAVDAVAGAEPVIFHLSAMTPNKVTAGGRVQIADSRNFPISKTVAAALVTVEPGGMRELHWHPNADEWQYYIKGEARMTVFNTGPKAQTADFRPGDLGYVKKSLGHYIQNTGKTELQFLEIFKTDRYAEVSLSDWLTHAPPQLVAQHLNIDPSVIGRFPRNRPDVVPA